MAPILEIDGLTKRFGHFTAVDQVSFKIEKGSIFGFLGPNGSGKSTVIRLLCGLLQPSGGKARIAGLDVARELEQIVHRPSPSAPFGRARRRSAARWRGR